MRGTYLQSKNIRIYGNGDRAFKIPLAFSFDGSVWG